MEDNYLSSGGVAQTLNILNAPPSSAKKGKDELYLKGYGRQFGEQMTYSVGCAYGSGLMMGGLWGFLEGVKRGGENRKLWVNSVVNGCATRGPLVANQLGIMTMFYVASSNLIGMFREPDLANAAIAGGFSGALFKSCAGLNVAGRYAAAGAIGFSLIDSAIKDRKLF